MKSSLRNMVLVLFGVTLISSAGVGIVYRMTTEPIAEARRQKVVDALREVLPAFDNDPAAEVREVRLDSLELKVYPALRQGVPAGYAVETVSNNGFSGEIRLMVGFDTAGNIKDIRVLEHHETPGLGSVMTDEDNALVVSFRGRNPAELKLAVRKDGGDIDALAGSTITSRAYIEAVDRAWRAVQDELRDQRIPRPKGEGHE